MSRVPADKKSLKNSAYYTYKIQVHFRRSWRRFKVPPSPQWMTFVIGMLYYIRTYTEASCTCSATLITLYNNVYRVIYWVNIFKYSKKLFPLYQHGIYLCYFKCVVVIQTFLLFLKRVPAFFSNYFEMVFLVFSM